MWYHFGDHPRAAQAERALPRNIKVEQGSSDRYDRGADRNFIAERFKPLQPDEALLVSNYADAPEKIVDLDRANVADIMGTKVTLEDFTTLAGSQNSLSPFMMDAMIRDRDAELSDLHKLTNILCT